MGTDGSGMGGWRAAHRGEFRSIDNVVKLLDEQREMAEMHRLIAWLIDAHATETAARNLVAIDIAPILSEEVATGAALAEEKGITITYHPIPFYALAEPALLSRALGNFLSNAIKYSPLKSIVRVKVESLANRVRVSVIDQGPGIPAGEADRLFQKFSRLSTQPTAAEPALGLGRYIVRTLAERMGAVVGWEPNPQGGSVFFLDLCGVERSQETRSTST